MRFFLDTANLDEIKEAQAFGLIDGVTTNPSLLAKEGGDWKKQMAAVCDLVDGPVSLEVVGTTAEDMLREAKDLIGFGDNVVVKIPMIPEGLKAIKACADQGIKVNTTLVFSAMQALFAARAGAAYVSPFVGRLDDIGHEGMELIEQCLTIFDNYALDTEVLVASVRSPQHVLDAALMGADVCTAPFKVLLQMMQHPLTDIGLEKFLADWKKVAG